MVGEERGDPAQCHGLDVLEGDSGQERRGLRQRSGQGEFEAGLGAALRREEAQEEGVGGELEDQVAGDGTEAEFAEHGQRFVEYELAQLALEGQ